MKMEEHLHILPRLPCIGVGTFKIKDELVVQSTLQTALAEGYRLIDTASCYRNHKAISSSLGLIMKQQQIQREELCITSKLAPKDQGYEKARASFLKSLEELDCDYIDLFLIHWPGTSKLKIGDPRNKDLRKESWKALEELQEQGLVQDIGVSNYTIAHLEEMETYARIKPSVNQVEFHPHLYQKELLEYCHNNRIQLQAYSSLGTGMLVDDPLIQCIATKYDKTVSQILLKWGLQHGVGVIPKSTDPRHIKENFNLFDFLISDEDMNKMDAMNIDRHYCWDSTLVA